MTASRRKATTPIESQRGLICPLCRYVDEDAKEAVQTRSSILRCPHDDYALVPARELARADGDPFLGMTLADRYVVLGRLGSGSMGTVYRARQLAMSRDVAVKILRSDRALDAQSRARFAREARALSQLGSAHTVTVFDFGEIHDPSGDELETGVRSLYLAMELLEGESLGDRLKRRGRLGVEPAVRIAREALIALAEAHDKGIVHRDLKPDNLFLTRAAAPDGIESCKVLDFGIAKVMNRESGLDALETQAGTVFGTPRYMSPEQAQGKSLDARSDLYSLGVILYHMLVGRPPFVDDDAVVVMARHIKTTPTPPALVAKDAGIHEALSDVIMRALAKDPDDRPLSAEEFIEDLDHALSEYRPIALIATNPPASGEVGAVVRDDIQQKAKRVVRRWRIAAVALAAVALLIVAARSFGPRPTPEPELRAGLRESASSRIPPFPSLAPPEPEPEPEPASSSERTQSLPASAAPSAATPPPRPPRAPKRRTGYKRFDEH